MAYYPEADRRYRERHPDRIRAKRKQHYKSHAEEDRLKREQERLQLLKEFGSQCVRCGFSDPRALQVDHINGGGRRHRKLMTSQQQYRAEIRAHKEEFQLLCANCNWIKRAENRECYTSLTVETTSTKETL